MLRTSPDNLPHEIYPCNITFVEDNADSRNKNPITLGIPLKTNEDNSAFRLF